MANSATSKDFLNSLKQVTMTKGLLKSLGNLASCTICLEDIKPGETASPLPCSHLFHRHCIVESLRYSNSCPNCRRQFPKEKKKESANGNHNRSFAERVYNSLSTYGGRSVSVQRYHAFVATSMGGMA